MNNGEWWINLLSDDTGRVVDSILYQRARDKLTAASCSSFNTKSIIASMRLLPIHKYSYVSGRVQ